MKQEERLIIYLKGISEVLKVLSKEIKKKGIGKDSLDLMKEVGSDLLFKGVSIDFTKEISK